jgi:ABC-2 type transport system permease protein
VATSVVEEKSSRVVELVLAKIRARELLAGKILGVGCCRHLWMTTVWQV